MSIFEIYFEYDESSPSYLKNKIGRSSKAKAGMVAGTKNNTGHYQVMLHGIRYQVHRVIFQIFHGEIPDGYLVDHIDGNRGNNHIDNLRLATHRDNTVNSKKKACQKMLSKGITEATPGYYVAQVRYGELSRRRSSRDIDMLRSWVISMRNELHGQFANHG